MIEAVYVGTLAPLLFLLLVLKAENRRLLLFLLWGLTAALAAYYLNAVFRDALRLTGKEESDRIAPALEELLKALPIYLYLFSRKADRSYESVRNALAAGIGFSILENVCYLTVSAPEGLRSALGFIILRSASACLLHGAATALTGYAVRQMRLYRAVSPLLILGTLGIAIVCHGIFNRIAGIPSAWFACVAVPMTLFAIQFFAWNLFGRTSASLPASVAEGTVK